MTPAWKPDHVFMTADAVGGVWAYALDLARGLSARGVRVTLAVLGPAPDLEQRSAAATIPRLRLIDAGLPLEWLATSSAAVEGASAALADMADDSGADLVHLNTPALGAAGRFEAPVLAAAHSDIATWWRAVKGGPMPGDFGWRAALVARGYAGAQAVVAPTAAFARATRDAYGLKRTPLVVHNGRTPRPSPAVEGCDAETAAPGAFVFTAGRLWDEAKGAAVLDAAAARLTAPVVAAGALRGPQGASIRLDHVRALGRVDETRIARTLAARPVFVSPSLYEPFGLAVLEAAQAACPLVLSDIATFRELWAGAAVFVPPGDAAALAGVLERVLRDEELRRSLGAAALARSRRYTVEAAAARMLAIYGALVDGRGAAAA